MVLEFPWSIKSLEWFRESDCFKLWCSGLVEHWINLVVHCVWTQVFWECEMDVPYHSNVIDAWIMLHHFKTLFYTTHTIPACLHHLSRCSIPPPWSVMPGCQLYTISMLWHACTHLLQLYGCSVTPYWYANMPCYTRDVSCDMGAITCLDTASSILMDLGCWNIHTYDLITPSHSLDTFPMISPCILVSDHPAELTLAGVSSMVDYLVSADVS
jgi:hypothetical protein